MKTAQPSWHCIANLGDSTPDFPASMEDVRMSQRVSGAWGRADLPRRAACLRLLSVYQANPTEDNASNLIIHLTHPNPSRI